MKRRQLLAAAGMAGAGLAVGSGWDRAGAAGPGAGRGWIDAPVDLPNTWLHSVDSRRSVTWAVGIDRSNGWDDGRPLVLRWAGGKWVSTPTPVHTNSTLSQVAIAGPSDVWAVGADYADPERWQPLILRWNGRGWRRVAPPVVPAGAFGEVKIAPDGSVWMAGWADIDGVERGVVYRYVNGGWELIADGLEQSINGNALLVRSATDAWLAVNPGLAHFDGKSWTFSDDIPVNGSKILAGFAAGGSKDLWAVGVDHNVPGEGSFAVHYDGSSWTSVAVPEQQSQLAGVAIWNGRVIAVGMRFSYQPDGSFSYKPYVLEHRQQGFVSVPAPTVPAKDSGDLTALVADGSRLWSVGGFAETAFAVYHD